MKVVMYVTFLLKLLLRPLATAASSCPAKQYSGKFQAEDYEKDRAIIGHSYKNLTIEHAQQCFSHCVSDCKCLSYQIFGKRCELLDENKITANLQQASGYKFYPLKQSFKNSGVSCTGECRNGCCHSNLCMNGGTCVETCQNVNRKFKCICPLDIQGRYCQFIMSCAGIPGNPKSGVHTITRPSLNSQFKVYCDFTSEPNYVWTLVESFEHSRVKVGIAYYDDWEFFKDHPVSESSPNWVNYRLSLEDMKHIKTNATHWRATCNFESANISTSDYVRVEMKTRDLMQPVAMLCHQVDFLRFLGTTCSGNCKTLFTHKSYHPYLVPCYESNCKSVFCSGSTDYYYELFGTYEKTNPNHHCLSSPSSTTNWWIGYKLN